MDQRKCIARSDMNEGTDETGGKFILNWRSYPASLILS